ncbi:hypothetical protein [Candidatus Methanosphaera massiliense]|jgi:cell division protein FtsX|uniref:hypothetical protein n=1 Tax=Methanosphaera TaxID=2316 RepID=UPI00238021D5|nr:hypothetical protein [Candidatus Methanosphaera massiliense]MDD6286133.1 hypothetical protein [Methanobacteriaceae archaeon]MDE4077702.1 hypothetical protein [Candidatus Methanosphaera massiliense]MDY2744738.1 hypothetical protein [Methanosphaera sp.]
MNEITRKLKNNGKITIIIIDNLKKKNKRENKEINNKIREINKINNINTKITTQEDTFKTLSSILSGEKP